MALQKAVRSFQWVLARPICSTPARNISVIGRARCGTSLKTNVKYSALAQRCTFDTALGSLGGYATRCLSTSTVSFQQISQGAKKRSQRKRKSHTIGSSDDALTESANRFDVYAYATAEEYDLEKLVSAFKHQGLYYPTSMQEEDLDVLHVSARYQVGKDPREIYFFREGAVVFWNVPELERENVLKFIKPFEDSSYDPEFVAEESEVVPVLETSGGTQTRLTNSGQILLNTENPVDLEKYAFSNAVAQSVKLAIWEATLERFIDSIEDVTEDLKSSGKIKLSRQEVLQKQGELFGMRHSINLSSDLLDTPDFYWDRENLEPLYRKMYNHLTISKRTKVMNEKLSHCFDLVQLLSDQLTDKLNIRLEWMIIVLIMVEVVFECAHYVSR